VFFHTLRSNQSRVDVGHVATPLLYKALRLKAPRFPQVDPFHQHHTHISHSLSQALLTQSLPRIFYLQGPPNRIPSFNKMVHLNAFILATVGLRLVSAAPLQTLEKRIDQVISDSTTLWQAACVGFLFTSSPIPWALLLIFFLNRPRPEEAVNAVQSQRQLLRLCSRPVVIATSKIQRMLWFPSQKR
jgi:hypothetical protein